MAILVQILTLFFMAAICSGIAAAVVWFGQYRQARAVRWRRTLLILPMPFVVVSGLVVLSMLAPAIERLTGADLHLEMGDSWHATLPNGYELRFVDVGDVADVRRRDARHEAISGVTHIATQGDRVYGQTATDAFMLDTASGHLEQGVTTLPPLMPVAGFEAAIDRIMRWVWWLVAMSLPAWLLWRFWTPRVARG